VPCQKLVVEAVADATAHYETRRRSSKAAVAFSGDLKELHR
jgi:hypothetical protein